MPCVPNDRVRVTWSNSVDARSCANAVPIESLVQSKATLFVSCGLYPLRPFPLAFRIYLKLNNA
jgi:hypothetical protein